MSEHVIAELIELLHQEALYLNKILMEETTHFAVVADIRL